VQVLGEQTQLQPSLEVTDMVDTAMTQVLEQQGSAMLAVWSWGVCECVVPVRSLDSRVLCSSLVFSWHQPHGLPFPCCSQSSEDSPGQFASVGVGCSRSD
jgi:hypothetical protein